MTEPVIHIKNISKQYRLGAIGTQTIQGDISAWWAKIRGKEDPFSKVGETNDIGLADENEYVWALKDINLQINKGEIIGFIGKNGAGKSTLLKILSRVTAPSTGEIKVKGRIASLLEVGTGFHPELTGRENVFLNGAILGMSKTEIHNKFDEIVEFSGVGRYIDTPVKRYSSGMYVRLAFAVAAHLEPEILIIDEVLAVGDADFQKKALGKMNEVAKSEGRTVLFVSHNMAAIQNLCTKCVVLEKGGISFSGEVNEGIEHYLKKNSYNDVANNEIEFSDNRSGNGNVQFSDFYIESENGEKIETILTGQNVFFVFILKVNKPNIKKIDLGFSIHNMQDVGLSNLYSSYQNTYFNDLSEGHHAIKCKIYNFSFAPGRLSIKGRILENGNEADWYKGNIGIIDVQMGNFYNTGVIGQANWGSVLLKGEWVNEHH